MTVRKTVFKQLGIDMTIDGDDIHIVGVIDNDDTRVTLRTGCTGGSYEDFRVLKSVFAKAEQALSRDS